MKLTKKTKNKKEYRGEVLCDAGMKEDNSAFRLNMMGE